jgi:poly(3-hydroxybutyrate) depolymerase
LIRPKIESSQFRCGLYLALHTCKQNFDHIQDQFEKYAGFNRWAESNNIIVVYPKTAVTAANPFGCWDWFGYTGADYATQRGLQVKALRKLVQRLSGV